MPYIKVEKFEDIIPNDPYYIRGGVYSGDKVFLSIDGNFYHYNGHLKVPYNRRIHNIYKYVKEEPKPKEVKAEIPIAVDPYKKTKIEMDQSFWDLRHKGECKKTGRFAPFGVACFAYSYQEKDTKEYKWRYHPKDICHIGLNQIPGYAMDSLKEIRLYICDKNNEIDIEKPQVKAYYDWLFNYSNFSEAFLTKTFEEARDFGIRMNLEARADLFGGAAIASRFPTEWDNNCKSWYKFVSLGISPNLAFIMSHFFLLVGEELKYSHYAYHKCFDIYGCRMYFNNFLNNKITTYSGSYLSRSMYQNINIMWGPLPTDERLSTFVEKVYNKYNKPIYKGEGWDRVKEDFVSNQDIIKMSFEILSHIMEIKNA